MLIKVCGITETVNAREVAALRPDMMGFIFYRPSPRNAFSLDEKAVRSLPAGIKRVGVFVDEKEDFVLRTAERYGLDYIQLHGGESPDFCMSVRNKAGGVMKAFGIATEQDLLKAVLYEGCCDLYVFDTKTPSVGGSGIKFDHSILDNYQGGTPFLLSGGIGPGDGRLPVKYHPKFAGYDLNSRFENKPGRKDVAVLGKFIMEVKNTYI